MPLVALRNQIVRKLPRPAGHTGHMPPSPWQPRRSPGFSPFVAPERPPPGLYDPAIDAQQGAVGRGYENLVDDTGRDRFRLATDTTAAKQQVDRGAGRSLADLLTAQGRGTEDRGRGYGQLGVRQGAAAQSQGVAQGGTLAASLAARAANQGREQGRANTDAATGRDRIEEDRQLGHGRLNLGLSEGNEDMRLRLLRAGDEKRAFGLDASEQRFFQAGQQPGYNPLAKPSNEFGTGADAYQVRKFGKNVGHYDSGGRLISLNGRRVVNGRAV